jgi:hypothetical protein
VAAVEAAGSRAVAIQADLAREEEVDGAFLTSRWLVRDLAAHPELRLAYPLATKTVASLPQVSENFGKIALRCNKAAIHPFRLLKSGNRGAGIGARGFLNNKGILV